MDAEKEREAAEGRRQDAEWARRAGFDGILAELRLRVEEQMQIMREMQETLRRMQSGKGPAAT